MKVTQNKTDMKSTIDQNVTFKSFIQRIHRDTSGFIEFRPCFDDRRGIDTSARRWFEPETFIEKSSVIIEYCRRHRLGCFFGVLPRVEKGRGTGDAVESGGVCWTDIDDKDHGGSRETVWTLVRNLPVPPSVVVESGGGLHLYFFLNAEYPSDEIAEMNERIAKIAGGDHCHDKARILRLPTSYHQKDPDNVRFVRFVEYDENIEYSIDDLSVRFPPVATSKIIKTTKIFHIPIPKLSDEVQHLLSQNPRLNEMFEGIGKTGGDQSGTGYDFAVARELAWMGVVPETIVNAIAYRVAKRGSRKGTTYILRTVERAVAVIANRRENPIDVTPDRQSGDPTVVLQLDRHPETHRDPSKRGAVKMTQMNLYRILTADPMFVGGLRFNDFKNRIEVAFDPTDIRKRDFRKIEDVHSKLIRHQIARSYGLEYSKDVTNDEILFVSRENTVHPVREYLSGLEWDGIPRVDSWLQTYCNAKISEFDDGTTNERLISLFGRKWMISAVARVMTRGCKVDTSLVLTGKQGAGKSTTFKILAKNPEWFRDSAINVNGGRDSYSLLSGVWIYEFAELQATRSRENESVKAFLSSTSDSYRPAYAHYDVDVPRQCVFVGTSNETEILRDPTGSRRFWVVEVGDIDVRGLTDNVDQLWAESYHHWKSGENWWLSDDVAKQFDEHSGKFRSSDSWSDMFEQWFNSLSINKSIDVRNHGVTLFDVLTTVIGIEVNNIGKHHEMRIGGVLAGLGWTKRRVRVKMNVNGNEIEKRVYRYFKGDE